MYFIEVPVSALLIKKHFAAIGAWGMAMIVFGMKFTLCYSFKPFITVLAFNSPNWLVCWLDGDVCPLVTVEPHHQDIV